MFIRQKGIKTGFPDNLVPARRDDKRNRLFDTFINWSTAAIQSTRIIRRLLLVLQKDPH